MSRDTLADEKAGFCSSCRSETHSLCSSATCTCKRRGLSHPNRPQAARPSPPLRSVAAVGAPEPKVALVPEDPPEPPRKLTLLDQVVEAVQEGLDSGAWYRVVDNLATERAAKALATKALATKLTKHEVTARMVLEWRASGRRVYVRGPQ